MTHSFPTRRSSELLQRAVYHVQSSGKKEVTGANVLVAIFGEKDSHAVYYLNQQDVARLDVVNYLSHGIARHGEESEGVHGDGEARSADGEGDGKADALAEFAVNLNQLARDGKRSEEHTSELQSLMRTS